MKWMRYIISRIVDAEDIHIMDCTFITVCNKFYFILFLIGNSSIFCRHMNFILKFYAILLNDLGYKRS